jgi:hypothetical protein
VGAYLGHAVGLLLGLIVDAAHSTTGEKTVIADHMEEAKKTI